MDIPMIAGVVATVLGVVFAAWKGYAANKLYIDLGLKSLSFVTSEISKRTATTADDKFALFLQHLSGQMEEKGKTVDAAKARAVFNKLQGK